jgi:hypothetical protein
MTFYSKHSIDSEYNNALDHMMTSLDYVTVNQIEAEDYDSIEEHCKEMGYSSYLTNRLLDLVPEEDFSEECRYQQGDLYTEDDEEC